MSRQLTAFLLAALLSVPMSNGNAQGLVGFEALEGANPGDTVWVTPRSRFEANFIQRFFLGGGYRDLWSLPVRAEVLDLDRFGGGLTPFKRGGGMQTPSIRLRSEEGPVYAFRSMDKDASRALDPELRKSIAADFAQDFVSAILPQGALVLDRLQEAAGVLHQKPRLVILPDDPKLGEFREDFAGVLGWIEVRADEGPDGEPGFAGADDVKGSEAFLEDLEESPKNRADSRAYLKARLMDGLVGDWDRHPDQWRWAGFTSGDTVRFEPVPRDRDWALAKLDGFKMWVSRVPWPHYVGFGFEYPSAFRSTWSGRVLDRRILPELAWEDWAAVAQELKDSLPDPIIEDAVHRLPPSHYEVVGRELVRGLKNRRNRLEEYARDFYLLLAESPDIYATDEDELAIFDRLPEDRLRVSIFRVEAETGGSDPYFERVFDPVETDEVRVHLRGGDDEARVQGSEEGGILITVVGGGGDDLLSVAGGGRGERVRFFDDRGTNRFEPGLSTVIDETTFTDPHDWREDTHWAGSRDWGSRIVIPPVLRYEGDGGLLIGGSLVRTGYGFRHYPFQDRSRITLAFGTRTERAHLEAETEFPLHRQLIQGRVYALATGAVVHRFYGFGNETGSEEELDFYRAFGTEYRLGGSAIFRISPNFRLEGGALYSLSKPDENGGTILARDAPYGFGTFNSLSFTGGLRWDGTDSEAWPTRGGTLELSGQFFPQLGDVEHRFGKFRTLATGYLSAPTLLSRPTLALRVGGEKVWGEAPYMEAAALGGAGDLRGFPEERFRGDASLFLSSELRLHLGTLPALLPGSWGIMGSTETGRVWYGGEDSDRWHQTYGGGAWLSIINTFTVTLSVARSDEGTRFLYGGGGFHF